MINTAYFILPVILLSSIVPRVLPIENELKAMKVRYLILECMKDIEMKIKSIQHVRRMYHKTSAFLASGMLFDLKVKYTAMLKILSLVDIKKASMLNKARDLAELQQMGMDIDKLAHMIEENENKLSKRNFAHVRSKHVLRMKQERAAKEKEKRSILRAQMDRIQHAEKNMIKRKKHQEDGFNSHE